jgi:hypothetical protein
MGGLIWGMSSALNEATEIDERYARYVNDNLADYLVPVNADVPSVEVIMLSEQDDEINPAGVKGVGELGNVGTNAAICNAIFTPPDSACAASVRLNNSISRPRRSRGGHFIIEIDDTEQADLHGGRSPVYEVGTAASAGSAGKPKCVRWSSARGSPDRWLPSDAHQGLDDHCRSRMARSRQHGTSTSMLWEIDRPWFSWPRFTVSNRPCVSPCQLQRDRRVEVVGASRH